MHVWIALKRKADARLRFLCGSRALFTWPTSTFFSKNNFKIRSHDTIHIFKNYFATMFLIFSFSKIISIQTDPMSELCTYACLGKSSTRMGDLLGSPCVASLAPLSFYLSKNMCVCHVNGFYCLMYLQLIGTGSL